jgi:hypothetical protein
VPIKLGIGLQSYQQNFAGYRLLFFVSEFYLDRVKGKRDEGSTNHDALT